MRKCTYIAKLPSKTPQFFKVKCRQASQQFFAKRLKKFTPNYLKYVKLNALVRKINTDKVGEPAFRMVLTAVGSYAVTLQDGTLLVPIGCLKD
jgi:hypothetical protein